ncbi:MAG: hypothetical protein ACXWFS_01700 [Thermoanaerobaculia bacterium]
MARHTCSVLGPVDFSPNPNPVYRVGPPPSLLRNFNSSEFVDRMSHVFSSRLPLRVSSDFTIR